MSKFCIKCGTELEDDAMFCDDCGTKQIVPQQPVTNLVADNPDQASKVNLSNGEKQSGFGIASLVIGIISLLTLGVFFVPEILGIVFGILGLSDKAKKHTCAIAGLTISILSFFFVILLLVI